MSWKTEMLAQFSARLCSTSNCCWVESDNGKSAEILRIECQQSSDPVTLHRRHEANVMRSEARHGVPLNQFLPKRTQLFAIGKQA